jgi:hypothetical protein
VKPGSRVLITSDPFPPDDFMLIFAFKLKAKDPQLQVWRLRAYPQAANWPEPWSTKVRIEGCVAVLE